MSMSESRAIPAAKFRLYVGNAFSLSMLNRAPQRGTPNGYTPRNDEPIEAIGYCRVPRPVDDPRELFEHWSTYAEVISCIGHADTAVILGNILGADLPVNRTSVKLGKHDYILVGQYVGPRLPEGATELPEGATIEWWFI